MKTQKGFKYSETHEWVKAGNDTAAIGITDFAQDSLGDIVYVELPEKGARFRAGSEFGIVESVKAVSDLNIPISGEVTEVNGSLEKDPGLLNTDPYGSWIIKVKADDPAELDDLMDEDGYITFCEREG